MFKSVDWKWLIIGIILGAFIHLGCTHPKSPLNGAFGFYYGSST